MTWYSASAIFYFEYKDGKQDDYLVWENVYLLEASSVDEARSKAESYARQYEGDSSGTLQLDGRAVTQRYCGLRKLMEARNSICLTEGSLEGAEVTFSKFLVKDRKSLDRLTSGESVEVIYDE
ncbi:MAG: DUF4288 domain-containing protein [Saprospiraceae bacterium]|nr:DUF4288 domain-containing protein [Saprospiraceae bacterium]MCB1724726.1 DUF4288 domain-containing protein [Gammaproteobacteria bacterium]MCP5299141.1 DUF4288 domain-containing protein [Chromatiaceae bacterium]